MRDNLLDSLFNASHCIKVIDHIVFTTLNCFMELLSIESFFSQNKTFRQMNNRYVVK